MDMVKSFKLKTTTDYSLLKMNKLNRAINKSQVERLTKNIKRIGLQVPIIVNRNNEVVDGQHRFIALKNLGKPIVYLESRNWTNNEDTMHINNTSRAWSALVLTQIRAKEGHPEVKKAYALAKRWNKETNNKLTLISAMEMLMYGPASSAIKKRLYEGTYKSDVESGTNIYTALNILAKYPHNVPSPYNQKIVRSLKRLCFMYERLNMNVIEKMATTNNIESLSKESDQYVVMERMYSHASKNI